MLHEKALKVFGKPNLGSRRIFNDEKSAMFKSDRERLLPQNSTMGRYFFLF